MKKYVFILGLICFSFPVAAQEQAVGDFYSELMDDEVEEKTKETDNASKSASDLLKQIHKQIDLPKVSAPKITHEEKVVSEKTALPKTSAPFGIYWGMSFDDVKATGADLTLLAKEGDSIVAAASNLPKSLKNFAVKLDFGDNDELWKIVAVSIPKDDNAGATKVLQVYKKYYELLEKKYGQAEETYTEKEGVSMGSKDFADALKNEEAKLFSKFEDKNVRAMLYAKVGPNNKSYIEIEYTNLQILRAREQQVLDTL